MSEFIGFSLSCENLIFQLKEAYNKNGITVNRQNLLSNDRDMYATIFQMKDLDFSDWLNKTLKSLGMFEVELRLHGDIESGTLSNAKARNSVGPELARQIAKGLGKPQAWVFYQLGIIDEDPEGLLSNLDARALNILAMLEGKTDAQKLAAETTLAALFESLERGTSGQGNVEDREATGRQDKDRP